LLEQWLRLEWAEGLRNDFVQQHLPNHIDFADLFFDPPLLNAEKCCVSELLDDFSQEMEGIHGVSLIGGPGQGKTTVTKFLSQIYRAQYLRKQLQNTEQYVKLMEAMSREQIEFPRKQRFPLTILLKNYDPDKYL